MWAWNPKNQGGDGRIVVLEHPDENHHCDRLELSHTWGACCASWGKAPKQFLQFQLLREGWYMVLKDGITPKDVHDAFMVIPEYREIASDDSKWPDVFS